VIHRKSPIDASDDKGEKPSSIDGNIEFRNVQFQYPSRKDVPILTGLNLKIKKGETVALVGSSGCGKSTCIQLIQRFYDPESGEVSQKIRAVELTNPAQIWKRIGPNRSFEKTTLVKF